MSNNILKDLEPSKVFYYFEKISSIPRGSGNEKEISNYLVDFAKERGLYVRQDDYLNVIIKKDGTKGYENAPAVILQGHMDIVCDKNKDVEHNFEKDGIKLLIDEDYVTADGTTLGADNGIAIAFALAILDSDDICHPPIEAVITTDEEVGLTGALNIDVSDLEGKYFINLDSEEEGEFVVSCAGGLRANINLPLQISKINTDNLLVKEIAVKNLKGGHSGTEIDKGRANANRLTGRVLCKLNKELDIKLIDIFGGTKDNVIPRESFCKVVINKDDENIFDQIVESVSKDISREYRSSDPDISIYTSTINCNSKVEVIDNDALTKLIFLLMGLPNGVQTMSFEIEDIVESSLNLGSLVKKDDKILFQFAVRSSVRSLKYYITKQLELFANICHAEFIKTKEYPEWEYNNNSKLIDICVNTYEKMYNKKPIVKALHAGLESGVFIEKKSDLDAISIGPNLFDVHSPDERLSISSTKRTWEYLLEVLKEIK
jgi:dipeptidase D